LVVEDDPVGALFMVGVHELAHPDDIEIGAGGTLLGHSAGATQSPY
jgi:hypothetical protein